MINRYRLRRARKRIATDPHPVTLKVRVKGADGDTYTDFPLDPVYRKQVTLEELVRLGVTESVVPSRWRVWELWQEVLELGGAPRPKQNDAVEDEDGVLWVIREIELKNMEETHKCYCYREAMGN